MGFAHRETRDPRLEVAFTLFLSEPLDEFSIKSLR
jgi:hypothetical protein